MLKEEGNLWDHFGKRWVVIPVNIGWRSYPDVDDPSSPCGPAPMGRGVAAELAKRAPSAPYVWGALCYKQGAATPTTWSPGGWIYFPTKALDSQSPHLSWRAPANPVLIERSLGQLANLRLPSAEELRFYGVGNGVDTPEVVVPLVGCGEGRLNRRLVIPMMEAALDDRFILVTQPVPDKHPF